ncbi:MAG: ArsR/SmtB family transcription factor [Candidatus Aminicenantia bacterium]
MDELSYKLFFKAISNKTRFEIIKLLRKGPKCVSDICQELGFEQSRVSHNLKCLENCGFVNSRYEGKNKIYSLDKETILPILTAINKHLEKYSERLKICGILTKKGKKF